MHTAHRADGPGTNELLDAIPASDRDRWFATLTPVFVAVRGVVIEPSHPLESVYFPLDAVISVLTPVDDDAVAEVATVGKEGVTGVPPVAGGSLPMRALCQVGGWALRMRLQAFIEAINGSAVVSDVVGEYLQSLDRQVAQAIACRRWHSNEERLSRWLLMRRDRLGTVSFPVTHEFIAELLGTHRTVVTRTARALERAGLVVNSRGVMTIVDRAGLEIAACECYGVITRELAGTDSRTDLRGQSTRAVRATSTKPAIHG